MPLGITAAGIASGASSLGSIGSFASGVSSLLGGFGIGKKKPSFRKQLNRQLQADDETIRNQIKATLGGYKAEGINPLAALGQTHQGSYVAGTDTQSGFDPQQIGQGVDRIKATAQGSVQRRLDELAVENAELSNDYLKTQVAGAQKALTRHALPPPINNSADQSELTGLVDVIANEIGSHVKGDPATLAGQIPAGAKVMTRSGEIRLPSEKIAEMIEDNIFAQGKYHYNEDIKPNTIPIIDDYKWFFKNLRDKEKQRVLSLYKKNKSKKRKEYK